MSARRPRDKPNPPALLRRCPDCGRDVAISVVLIAREASARELDRLAHAVCGCYVLTMTGGGLARLMASVLSAPADLETETSEDDPA